YARPKVRATAMDATGIMSIFCVGRPSTHLVGTDRSLVSARQPWMRSAGNPYRLWTEGAGAGPRFHERAKLRLRSRCGRAPRARYPRPADQTVLGNVLDQRG